MPGESALSPPPSSPRLVTPKPATLGGRIAAALIYATVRGMDVSLRYELRDPSGSLAEVLKQPAIFATWHNRLALSLVLYGRYVQRASPARRMAAMVSASRDGGMLARVLERFRVQPVRGSSSRRGAQAVLEMTSWAERGYDLAITPDGPRGPRYEVQEGVVSVARLTGLPILPVSYSLPAKIQAKSWDRFQVPVPFSRCVVQIGELLRVSRESTDAERESLRQELQSRLRAITQD